MGRRSRALNDDEVALYDHVPPEDARRARLVTTPILSPGANGMTLGRWVLLRRGHEAVKPLIAHELVHVRQWREQGRIRFLARYLAAYLGGLVRLRRHRRAYLAIPFEVEAREEADAWKERKAI